MIETREHEKTVQGNLSGPAVAMSIDAEYMGHIMNVLTDMYEDRVKAIIREYSTNARDAMIEAGRGAHPIEVTLPSSLSPFFMVKDTGVGLDADGITSIYSRYGASTKRATNDQVGMLGIGCKSALAYADQFTLVGVKDGTRTQVAISRDAKDGGAMTIVDEAPTTEPNGVEIVVPVKSGDASDFENKAADFFSYWEPGTVLVNGAAPVPFTDNAIPIPGTEMWVVRDDRNRQEGHAVVVMGNVPYPTTIKSRLAWQYTLVARVSIGAVNFPPNRESLRTGDPTTETTLEGLREMFNANAGKAVQAQIDKATSKRDALKARAQWGSAFFGAHKAFMWKGQKLPSNVRVLSAQPCGTHSACPCTPDPKCSKCVEAEPCFYTFDANHRDWGVIMAMSSLALTQLDPDICGDNVPYYLKNRKWALLVGYDRGEKPTPTVKRKLMQYLDDNNIEGISAVVMFRELHQRNKDALSWIEPLKTIQWADVWATKLPRAAITTNSGRVSGSYPVAFPPPKDYVPPTYGVRYGGSGMDTGVTMTDTPANELPAKPIYVRNKHAAKTYALRCNEPVVYLTEQRVAKFLRENPGAREAEDVAKKRLEAYVKTLSEDEKLIMRGQDRYSTGVNNPYKGWVTLDKHSIKDTEVLELIRLGKLAVQAKVLELRDLGGNPRAMTTTTTFTDPRPKYPLLDNNITKDDAEHAALYINAVYEAAQAKGV